MSALSGIGGHRNASGGRPQAAGTPSRLTSPSGDDRRPASAAPAGSRSQTDDAPMGEANQPGSVRIARRVLRSVVAEAALSAPGVAELGGIGARWPQVLGRPFPLHGVGVLVHDSTVIIDLYLVVRPGANIVEVGSAVQEAVGLAVERLLGMTVGAVNVFIQDVV